MKKMHFFVSGDVQGVFYRQNTIKKARTLGLKGFVRNAPDGRVEILAEGEEGAVDELVSFCKTNPGHSQVEKLEIKEEKEVVFSEFKDFNICY
ncbi:acylphosphatase [Candidatus Woesearchaeota archaeon]|nr:acylphosphatase [Candidatus Woesearchaeota archaeon]